MGQTELAYALFALALAGWAIHVTVLHRGLHRARLCPVTRLPTRETFMRRAPRGLRRPDAVALFVDLDRFKAINDTYGHRAGDAALRTLADRLRAHFGPEAVVGRFGGDELVVVAQVPSAELEAELARLRRRAQSPWRSAARCSRSR
jgi:diguanylate cyclase (GGDEF)-like protein